MHLDKEHPIPVYIQLKDILRTQIDQGVYRSHQKLPSERELSRKYNLSRMTARRALQELIAEGLAYTRPGKGTFVNQNPDSSAEEQSNLLTQAHVLYNPYIAGPPIIKPDMFFGRQTDLEKIISLLMGNFVMLIGQRRIGKTSLLHQLKYHLSNLKHTLNHFVAVLVNVEGTPETELFHTIMEEVITVVQTHLPIAIIEDLSFDISDSFYSPRLFSRDLQIVLKNLQTTTPKPSRLVLLLDEMDILNDYSLETQSQLRRIFQRFVNHNLSVVVAGVSLHRHWAGESSPFYNMFMPVELTPFSKTEARRLITEPVKGVYFYSEDAILRIIEATSALPHRIQQLCLEIIYYLQATAKRRTEITQDDVDTVLQTIHWLDEEIDTPDKGGRPTVAVSPPAIAEQKTRYDTLVEQIETYQKTHPDDLTVVRGIGPVYQRKLRDIGFSTFEQLSRANPDQLRRLLNIRDWQRINIESWIEQARYWAQKDQ